MASNPSVPKAQVPAVKPQRNIEIAPEDIELGGSDAVDNTGKKQLKRPRTASGTGLSV